MNRATQFRYANQLAGAFLLAALALFLLGIFFMGKAKGWFEGKLTLHARFETPEGSFGLQEGNEIYVRNTVAGLVGKVVPNAQGQMETTFILSSRFGELVAKDSVAKVKKKFGVAGDSFVDIQAGKGPPVRDGDLIVCQRDEELMDTAQKMLRQVQESVIPTLEEVRQIVHSVNLITAGLAGGEGLAGAALKDSALADQVKEMLTASTELVVDSQQAVRETTRLLKATQKHWLLRKYVEKDPDEDVFAGRGLTGRDLTRAHDRWKESLAQARLANDPAGIAQAACGLAGCLISEGAPSAQVEELLEEARTEAMTARDSLGATYLVEADWLRVRGETDAALHAASAALPVLGKKDVDLRIRAQAMQAQLLCERGRVPDARRSLQEAERLVEEETGSDLRAMLEGAWASVLLGENQPEQAGKRLDGRAEYLRQTGSFREMAAALDAAAEAFAKAGKPGIAADRYFRSGRSLLAAGLSKDGLDALNRALPLARESGDEYLVRRVESLSREISLGQPPKAPQAAPSAPAVRSTATVPAAG